MILRSDRIAVVLLLWLVFSIRQFVDAQTVHRLDPTPSTVTRGYYSAAAPPALKVRSGDLIDVSTLISNPPERLEQLGVPKGQIQPALRRVYEETAAEPGLGPHVLTGPIYIEAAEPGDALEVEFVTVELSIPYALNFNAGDHVLRSEFTNPSFKLVPLDLKTRQAQFGRNIVVPTRPFFGSVGVALPIERGKVHSGPPGEQGGNFDNKDLVAGSKLLLPVHVVGALLFIGDGHAGQGDGEVNGTALETSLHGRVRLTLRKRLGLRAPRAETPTHFITMGLDADLDNAARIATSEMVAFLAAEKHLSRDDAYHLCSIAGDLSITQAVDGTKGVHMKMPKGVFK